MKNERTPRTLADCEFTTGYPEKRQAGGTHPAEWVIVVLLVIASVLSYLGLIA